MIIRAFETALSTFPLALRTRKALADVPRGRVLAVGKSAVAMALGAGPGRGLIIAPDGTSGRVMHAAHPVPDQRSVAAGRAALDFVSDGDEPCTILISGGASSLLCLPAEGLTFERKLEVWRQLLQSGLSIGEMNTVRRHLSRIKGGALFRRDRPMVTIIASDVIGGEAHDIGSGPSVSDPTTVDDARRIAKSIGLPDLPFIETLKDVTVDVRFAARPEDFAEHLSSELTALGIYSHVKDPLTGSITEAAEIIRADAASLTGQDAIVRCAEPRITLPAAHGHGGRCTHLASLVARDLPSGVVLLAGATDGIDGTSGTGGALVSRDLDDAREALAAFDTGPFHLAHGTALPAAPTGLNFSDVLVVYKES